MIFKARVLNEIMNIERLGKGERVRRRNKELVVLEGNKDALSKGNSALRKRCGQPC